MRRIRAELPEKTIWSYSGYTWETLQLFSDERCDLLREIDVLIDGQFIAEERDESDLPAFAGSSNQRLIDVPDSLAHETVVQHEAAVVQL